jgi:hypothetical protein
LADVEITYIDGNRIEFAFNPQFESYEYTYRDGHFDFDLREYVYDDFETTAVCQYYESAWTLSISNFTVNNYDDNGYVIINQNQNSLHFKDVLLDGNDIINQTLTAKHMDLASLNDYYFDNDDTNARQDYVDDLLNNLYLG